MPIQSFMSHGAFDGGNFVAGMSLPPGGSPLRAMGGAVLAAADVTPLSQQQLQPLVTQAMALWQIAGTPSSVSALNSLEFRIADLPDDLLGLAFSRVIYLDHNAAGHGWHSGWTTSSPRIVWTS